MSTAQSGVQKKKYVVHFEHCNFFLAIVIGCYPIVATLGHALEVSTKTRGVDLTASVTQLKEHLHSFCSPLLAVHSVNNQ